MRQTLLHYFSVEVKVIAFFVFESKHYIEDKTVEAPLKGENGNCVIPAVAGRWQY